MLFVFTAVTEAEGNRWIFRGPARTNVTVLIDPLVSTVLYAQSGDSLFRSLDAAASWQVMSDALPGAAVLLVSQEAPNTLYARHFNSSGRSEIFRSSDGGATWAQLQTDLDARAPVVSLAVAATTPATIYVGTQEVCSFSGCTYAGGAFKSTNGGTGWKSLGLNGHDVLRLTPAPTNLGLIYAMNNDLAGEFFRSADGGGHWTVGRSPITEYCQYCPLAVDPVFPSTVYVGDRRGVFKSTTGGASWTLSTTGLPAINSFTAVVIDPSNPTTIYAGKDPGGVFRSTDGGSTWSDFTDGLTSSQCGDACLSISTLVIDPTGNHLYAGTFSGVFELDFTARVVTRPPSHQIPPRVVVPATDHTGPSRVRYLPRTAKPLPRASDRR